MRIYVAESINYRTVGYINDEMHSISWTEENAAGRKMEVMDEFQIEASLMKVWDSEALGLIADDAVQTFGGYGFSSEYPPEKIYRDNRINRLFEGTNEINRMIIAGQIFKKCGNQTLVLRKDIADLPAPVSTKGNLSWAFHAIELAKRRFQYSAATALEVCGQKLIENQEASSRVADMAMEIYAMESALVRASKMVATSHRWASLAADLTNIFVNETIGKIRNNAMILLAEVLEGKDLQQAVKDMTSFDACPPISSAKIRDKVASELIEKGIYPIEQL
jgi:alkylation response protein AidB-like acyl-CoA dehydrogenase